MDGRERSVSRGNGVIAIRDAGAGPIVLAVPGMGDIRNGMAPLVGPLVACGFRVITMAPSGTDGSSEADDLGDSATADDMIAVLEEFGEPAVIVGNSFAGSAAFIAAARRPDIVRGVVSICGFVREQSGGLGRLLTQAALAVALAAPWGARFWRVYQNGALVKGVRPSGWDEHLDAIGRDLRGGALATLRKRARQLNHDEVAAIVARVSVPVLHIVGALDPDYRDPAAELAHMGEVAGGEALLVPDAAHYPHAQRPEVVVPAVTAFLNGLVDSGRRWLDA